MAIFCFLFSKKFETESTDHDSKSKWSLVRSEIFATAPMHAHPRNFRNVKKNAQFDELPTYFARNPIFLFDFNPAG